MPSTHDSVEAAIRTAQVVWDKRSVSQSISVETDDWSVKLTSFQGGYFGIQFEHENEEVAKLFSRELAGCKWFKKPWQRVSCSLLGQDGRWSSQVTIVE